VKVMIAGGYDEAAVRTGDRVIVEFVRHLAAQIISEKHQIRCANISSLDAEVIESGWNAALKIGLDTDKAVVSYHPKGLIPRSPLAGVRASTLADWSSMGGRRPSVPEPIAQADVVILVGGYGDATGTYTAANWARQTGTPILPVATFGLASAEIFNDLSENPERSKITGLPNEDLQELTRAPAVLTAPDAIINFARKVLSLAEKAVLSREVFLIMSFERTDLLEDYKAAVEAVCAKAGFEAVRTDSRPHDTTHQIIDSIHNHIQRCGFVIADLTNPRPNVYYEIGYAMGLKKRLIITSYKGSDIHFDLQGYTRTEWSGSENLKSLLKPIVAEVAKSFGLEQK